MTESLTSKAATGAIWTAIERFGAQFVTFLVTLALARVLTPGDYGVVGILMVFMAFSQMLIDCGLTSALVRRKTCSDVEYATVFWVNLLLSVFCYIVLFCTAPLIAAYYNMRELQPMIDVLGVSLIINALYSVHIARLTVLIDFRTQAKVTLIKSVVSGLVGIFFAIIGFGAWALIAQTLAASVVAFILYCFYTRWMPRITFSLRAIRELLGFGVKIMFANLMSTLYLELPPLIIGRKFSADTLGYYARGSSLAAFSGGICQGVFSRVVFTVLAKIQDDQKRLSSSYSRYIQFVVSCSAPIMTGMIACAHPIVLVLFGEKWMPCIPVVQIIAIGWLVDPIAAVNQNVFYVKNRADIVLKTEIIKKIVAILLVVVSVQYGVIWLCIGRCVYGYFALCVNLYYSAPLIGMNMWRQFKDVLPTYIVSCVMGWGAFVISESVLKFLGNDRSFVNNLIALVLSVSFGVMLYGFLAIKVKLGLYRELKWWAQSHSNSLISRIIMKI